MNMPQKERSKRSLSFKESFAHAWRGIKVLFVTTRNARVHMVIFVCAVILGIYVRITNTEWMMLFFAAGFVFATEAVNTAIEIDMDLTSPQFHPYARDTKDVAAGAVLIAAITAFVIGVLIFAPHLGIV